MNIATENNIKLGFLFICKNILKITVTVRPECRAIYEIKASNTYYVVSNLIDFLAMIEKIFIFVKNIAKNQSQFHSFKNILVPKYLRKDWIKQCFCTEAISVSFCWGGGGGRRRGGGVPIRIKTLKSKLRNRYIILCLSM